MDAGYSWFSASLTRSEASSWRPREDQVATCDDNDQQQQHNARGRRCVRVRVFEHLQASLRVACTSIKYTVDTAHICRCSQNGGEREASLGSSTVSVLSVIVNRPIYPSVPRSFVRLPLSLFLCAQTRCKSLFEGERLKIVGAKQGEFSLSLSLSVVNWRKNNFEVRKCLNIYFFNFLIIFNAVYIPLVHLKYSII